MTEKLKLLGLALVAVFAMIAVMAASAEAAGKFTVAGGAGTKITGEPTSELIFNTTAGEVECSTTSFSATATGTEASELTVTPTYTGCALAGLAATVDFAAGGCDYNLTAEGTGWVIADVVCSNGTIHIKKKNSECEVTVFPQNFLLGTAANITVGGAMATSLPINVGGIHYEVHHGNKCANRPASETVFTDGTYGKGAVQLTAPGGITVD